MEQYYQGLLGYLTIKLRDRNLAADVTHDAYLKVLESPRLDTLEYPKAFLYRTAINLCVDAFRRGVVRNSESLGDIVAEEGPQTQGPHATLYQLQRAELVMVALEELSDKCRQAFLLRKLDGLCHDEIATAMGISKAMVEKHIVNAMKHCRVRVSEMERLSPP
ncbi:sigma-70 family RNA polymerase sigma factor [Pseudomonas syringae]|nr:sigma-70 family RNA polymerase sigma factor [Pseudomonas syringae]MBD8573698.1 sigma-70 family RNA polymerase sigma factor [Pseudomonas syringae]MBD8789840.1 sigma-70 family RNA polymerase sigma factor [Pseudomonas syringae]MBD8799815.1 sigma-70 family RNA polymerase sigma factor [Pseudomonas syringae]MBD8811189.1 sigma-70 family RNA polymerase sigma factor [Pseudomonas syringae]